MMQPRQLRRSLLWLDIEALGDGFVVTGLGADAAPDRLAQ